MPGVLTYILYIIKKITYDSIPMTTINYFINLL